MAKTSSVTILEHPLVQQKLSYLRSKTTPPDNFRRLVSEISEIMAYEMTRDLKTRKFEVHTPIANTTGHKIADRIALVPIMRAGQAMLDGMLQILPFAAVGHIGIYRDKFVNNTVEYYFRVPKGVDKMRCFVLDPMLATGDTAIAAVARLKEYNVKQITFACLLAAREGVEKFSSAHPDVPIYTASVEPGLNKKGYIIPGLGDAGDRIYGTIGADV